MTQNPTPPNRSDKLIRNSTVEFLIFTAQEGGDSIQARYEDETLWLTKQLMAELFGTTRANISIHLRNIYESGELTETATCKEFLQVRTEGSRQVSRRLPWVQSECRYTCLSIPITVTPFRMGVYSWHERPYKRAPNRKKMTWEKCLLAELGSI